MQNAVFSPASLGPIDLALFSGENVTATQITHLALNERPWLCGMLEHENDFPQNLLYLYQRSSGPDKNLIARSGNKIDGLLNGSFRHDFSDNPNFMGFDLPQSTHALLTRIHVRHAARGHGVGRALVEQFAIEAIKNNCGFIGGYLDRTSDKTGRTLFFERLGFTVNEFDSFGVRPEEIIASASRFPR